MIRSLKAATVLSGALMLGIFFGATSQVSLVHADTSSVTGQPMSEQPEPPPDPKKKKPGDECKNSNECQNHHTCTKVGDKNICQAPPRARLPPGAVT